MRPNKAETAVRGCHCPDDKAVRMRKVLARLWVDAQVCQTCFYCFFFENWYLLGVKKISSHIHKTGSWYLVGVLFNSTLLWQCCVKLWLDLYMVYNTDVCIDFLHISYQHENDILFEINHPTKVNAAGLNSSLLLMGKTSKKTVGKYMIGRCDGN